MDKKNHIANIEYRMYYEAVYLSENNMRMNSIYLIINSVELTYF